MSSVHESCQRAIHAHIQHPNTSNVSKDENDVSCVHSKSQCNWVGNGVHYTCLKHESSVPQNVYDTLSGGNQSKLIRRED